MKLPDKIPPVVGRGKLARNFAFLSEKYNELIDALESLQPKQSAKSRTVHTRIGFTNEPITKPVDDVEPADSGPPRYA